MKKDHKTSWEPVSKWYHKIVGNEGHYYHQNIIIPKLLGLLNFKEKGESLLDLACGQGVMASKIPADLEYMGIDISPTLIKEAKTKDKSKKHGYLIADVAKPLSLDKKYTHAVIILALQNIENVPAVLANVRKHLTDGGKLAIVLNHPCFRIPRQSSWEIDEAKKLQYRRVDRYFSAMPIPIQAHPSKGGKSAETMTYHHPLSYYCGCLKDAGFVIETMEEWCSDKESVGKNAKMENRSRDEFPLFLTIVARGV
jgi:ubiquinone/menaquinone biosynthesis C-methylase UbiE